MSAFGTTIAPEAIRIFDGRVNKQEALDGMIDAVMKTGMITDRDSLHHALFEREAIRSTGFRGVAIPHVRIDEILKPTIGVGIAKEGIEFDALDNDSINIIVLFAMPSGSDKEYLGLLAKVMMSLRTPGFCPKLIACSSPHEVLDVLGAGT